MGQLIVPARGARVLPTANTFAGGWLVENVSFAIQAPSLGRERLLLPTDLLLVDQRGWCTHACTHVRLLLVPPRRHTHGGVLVARVTEWFVGTEDVADPDWDTWRGCKSSRSLPSLGGDFRGRDIWMRSGTRRPRAGY